MAAIEQRLTKKFAWFLTEERARPGISQDDLRIEWSALTPDLKTTYGQRAQETEREFRKRGLAAVTAKHPSWNQTDIWRGGYFLGLGSFGVATLWLRADANNCIEDRQVIKECDLSAVWGTDGSWYEHPYRRVTLELKAMQQLYNDPRMNNDDKRHFIQLRGFSPVDLDKQTQTLRMDFCEYGDLSRLMERYFKDNGGQAQVNVPQVKYLPEPFIWYVFETLMEACIVMQQEALVPSVASSFHQPIVHRDLKLDNIFLSSKNPNKYASYPRPVVADFGLAALLPMPGMPDHMRNPIDYADEGTLGWLAPEQQWTQEPVWPRNAVQEDWKIGPHTNVWGVGAIIARLLSMEDGSVERYDYSVPALRENWFYQLPAHLVDVVNRFSPTLRDLTSECIRFDPTTRPTARQVLGRIRTAVDSGPGGANLAQGMEQGPAIDWVSGNMGVDAHMVRDQYAIGLARPGPPDLKFGGPT